MPTLTTETPLTKQQAEEEGELLIAMKGGCLHDMLLRGVGLPVWPIEKIGFEEATALYPPHRRGDV